MDIIHGRFAKIPYVESPNQGGALKPEAIVIHYTAGPSMSGAIATLTSPVKKVSAHVVISREGTATQLVPTNRQAWHAGRSEWAGRPSLNHWALGIELVNAGWLRQRNGHWTTWWGDVVPDADVVVAAHKSGGRPCGWQKYTEDQIATAFGVCSAMCDAYPDIRLVLGHDDVAPGRKRDPGPAFPMDDFRKWLDKGPAPELSPSTRARALLV